MIPYLGFTPTTGKSTKNFDLFQPQSNKRRKTSTFFSCGSYNPIADFVNYILYFSLKLVIVALCCVLGGVKSGSHLLSFRLASCGRGHCCETSLKVISRNVHFILFHIKVKCFRLLDSEFGPTFFVNENPSFPHPPEKVLSDTQDLNIYFSTCVF